MVVFESSALLTAHPYLQRKTYALDMDGGAHRMRKCSVISQAGLQVSEFAVLSKLGLLGAETTGVVGRRYHLVQLVDVPLKFVCHASRGEPTAFDDSLPPHRGCGLIPRFPERNASGQSTGASADKLRTMFISGPLSAWPDASSVILMSWNSVTFFFLRT
ncbi:hypothetical protein ACCS68_35730 [Rhizobium beringeri]|uniref:hypothetical protein n=1 Tax=Rhizobium beringeri TaxID=3019934 RepID=UPI003CF1DE5E